MKERNRTISRILLIVSAGILLLQTLLMALLLKESVTLRIAMPLLFLVGEIIAGGVLCFATLNPDKFNRNYTLKKREGGLRFERITYGPDPEGLRYISAGINTLAIVLIFAAIAAALLWPERFNGDFFIPVVSVSMIMVISVVFAVTEMKLRKKIE